MLTAQRAISWIGAAGVAAVLYVSLLWLSVPSFLLLGMPVHLGAARFGGSPALYDPFIVVATVVCMLIPAAVFFLLSRKVERSPGRAWRYLVPSVIGLVALSAWWYTATWSAGLSHQGSTFVYANLALSAVALVSMGALAVWWRSRRTPALPMLFLWLEFAWVLGCAFPWLGETF
jgi:hypothetical protein